MKLYHWTCLDHGSPAIMASGFVEPRVHPMLDFKLSWWTHIPWASRDALGLSSHQLVCDRMSQQFVADVDPHEVAAWTEFRRGFMARYPERASGLRQLEAAPGAKPSYWWVAPEPIPVSMVLEVA